MPRAGIKPGSSSDNLLEFDLITSKSNNLKIGVNCLANRLCLLNKKNPIMA